MMSKKLFVAFILAGVLCAVSPALAQNPSQQGPDPVAIANALKNCPGLTGKVDAAAIAAAAKNCPALAGIAQGNCPALNGQIDPQLLAAAMQNCPAFNGAPCPAANGQGNCPALNGGFQGPIAGPGAMPALDQKVDKRMNRIVRALERNKRSAEILIQAAKDAGADPNAVADLQKMSQAFREVFMSTVSPQQIIESIISAQPAVPAPEGTQGFIIEGPDGQTWLISPSDQPAQPTPPQGRPPKGPKPGMQAPQQPPFQPGMQTPPPPPAPQGKPSAIGRPQMPQPVFPQPGIQPPQPQTPPAGMPPAFRVPPQQNNAQPQQGEVIIMEQMTPQYMPLWPTKDDLGKDGVLKYLEKRNQLRNSG